MAVGFLSLLPLMRSADRDVPPQHAFKIRMETLRDSGACLSAPAAFQLLQGLEVGVLVSPCPPPLLNPPTSDTLDPHARARRERARARPVPGSAPPRRLGFL